MFELTLRSERPGDERPIAAVHSTAFRRSEQVGPVAEATLVADLRASAAWIDDLSVVAVVGEQIIGHVVCSRAHVDAAPVLGLGPIAVLPGFQGRGVGSQLMRMAVTTATEMSEPMIGLLGSPEYYSQFGFVAATSLGVRPPDPAWGAHFQALALPTHTDDMVGTFRYAEPFDAVS